jgi:tRNA pseudouridine38-40 synthase
MSEPNGGTEETGRLRVDLGYRGTDFHGWATQPGLRTVQGELEAALAQILRRPVRVTVAGRTDAGVHARRQTIHLDLVPGEARRLVGSRAERTPAEGLLARLRGVLRARDARDIVIHSAAEVPSSFDARFAAIWRSYTYRLADEDSFLDPLLVPCTTVVRGRLDAAAMASAAGELLGLHDFLPFCKPRPDATTIRTLRGLEVARDAAGVIVTRLRADAFCHHMVRALIGGLVRVGSGAWPTTRPAELLALAEAGVPAGEPMYVMEPHGLVLEAVGYPEESAWAAQGERARAKRRLD